MNQDESYLPSIAVRVVYEDPPDLIEIETGVRVSDWVGSTCAYISPASLREQAALLAHWSRVLQGECVIEAGADTGIGWVRLRFYTIDSAAHVACHASLATSNTSMRPESVARLSVEMFTEPGQVERFAAQLNSINVSPGATAILAGLPAPGKGLR